jgi:perosamine synthetase
MKKVIPWAKPNFWGCEKKYVNDALNSLWISSGKYIEELENGFSNLLNKKFVLATSNGTTSLHLIYLGLDLRKGDEIIVPGFAFLAASNIAMQLGLIPVFAEVDKDTWCVTAEEIQKKISKKTKAIVPIHTYGNVCEMNRITKLAAENNIVVIEDCAESLFSKFKNNYCGSFGDVNSFSFQATKTITTGEGGMVVTDNEQLYKKMTLYRSHGLTVRGRYWHEVPGNNFRLTNLQAAMGFAQFEKRALIIIERRRVFDLYKKYLGKISGITLQKFSDEVEPVVWAVAIMLDDKAFPQGRDNVILQLKEKKIETRPGFVASSLLKIYSKHSLEVCEYVSNHVLSLPTFPMLTEEQIIYICETLQFLKK